MSHRTLSIALVSILAACGGEADTPPVDDAAPAVTATGTVRIVEPAAGDTVDGPSVTVRLDVSGLRIVAAGDTTGGTGHHHLFLDDDVSAAGVPIPAVPGRIVHMGDASSAYVFEDVPAGEHRLIAVVGDGVHVPLQPWVVDTVTFTVRR